MNHEAFPRHPAWRRERRGKRAQRLAAERHRAPVRGALERSLCEDIPLSDAKSGRAFDNTMDASGQHLGLVVTLGSGCRAVATARSTGTFFIGEGGRIVSVTALNIDPGCGTGLLGGKLKPRLAKGIEIWARALGATHILYHVTTGAETARADRSSRTIGMKQLGGTNGTLLA